MTRQFNKPMNNRDIVEHVLDVWTEKVQYNEGPNHSFNTDQKVDSDAHETVFVTTNSSAKKLSEIAENHSKLCPSNLKLENVTMSCHL